MAKGATLKGAIEREKGIDHSQDRQKKLQKAAAKKKAAKQSTKESEVDVAALEDVTGGADDKAWGLSFQRDGKLIAAGQSNGEAALVRYNPDGSLDTTFGVGGKVLTAPAGQ